MIINEQYRNLELTEDLPHIHITREGQEEESEKAVLREHLIDVYVNEALTMKLVCCADHLTELVLGRLYTEGIIESTDDVDMIYICEYGSRAKVTLNAAGASQPEGESFVETTPSCCTGNHVLNDYFVRDLKPQMLTPIEWKHQWIFDMADRFRAGTALHNKTTAAHSCFLSHMGEIVFECEDLGRHNALDKAIGFALRNGINLKECLAYSSGRIPTDMAMKAVKAGIPVLASKAAPTFEAVSLAKEYGLTLIGQARTDSMKQYSGPKCL